MALLLLVAVTGCRSIAGVNLQFQHIPTTRILPYGQDTEKGGTRHRGILRTTAERNPASGIGWELLGWGLFHLRNGEFTLSSAIILSEPLKTEPQSPQILVAWTVADVQRTVLLISSRHSRREPLSSKATRSILGAQGKSATHHGSYPALHDRAGPLVRLARRPGDRKTRDVPQMASNCVSDVLALEIPQNGSSDAAEESERDCPRDGS